MDIQRSPKTNRGPQGLVLVERAAEILGLSPWTVRDKARRRLLPHYRPFGPRGRIAFDPDDLDRFVRASRVEPRCSTSAPEIGAPMAAAGR